MSLTQAQMDAVDEMPQRRGGGTIYSFTAAAPETSAAEVRTRSRLPRWAIRAAARRRQLNLMAMELERERLWL
jgi:hypothetical protein